MTEIQESCSCSPSCTLLGLCHCGCGKSTKRYNANQPKRGQVLGQYAKWWVGHHPRQPRGYQESDYTVDDATGCWNWNGAPTTEGYGRKWTDGKQVYAHRFVYETLVGPIPDGLYIDHLCRNTMCVNPDHLEPVTPKQNSERGLWGMTTHCPYGHPYDEANTMRPPRGGRLCRTCNRERARWNAAQKRRAS